MSESNIKYKIITEKKLIISPTQIHTLDSGKLITVHGTKYNKFNF